MSSCKYLTLGEHGYFNKECWFTIPIDEEREYVFMSNDKKQILSNQGTDSMLCQLVEEDDYYIKLIGEAKLEVEFEGESYKGGAYEINNMCFKLYNMIKNGLISYTLLKEEFDKVPQEAKKQFKTRKCWLPSFDALYTTFYGKGKQKTYSGAMCDYGIFSIDSNTTSSITCWICPMFLIAKNATHTKIRVTGNENGEKEHPYQICFVD